MTPYVLLAVFAVAWFIANEKTNSKAAIYILFLGGLFALVVFWMSTLTGGVELLKLAGATAATIIFGVFGSTIAAMKIKKEPAFSMDSVLEGATLVAVILGLIGFTILICGSIPDNISEGPESPIDRKYSLLFFGLTAYAFLFSFLTNRKIKSSQP